MNDTTTTSSEPVVRFARLKLLGTFLIGSLIAVSSFSDADHALLFGPVWGPRSRLLIAGVLGGFYATERYITKSGTWYKSEEKQNGTVL